MNQSTLTIKSITCVFIVKGHFDPSHLHWTANAKFIHNADGNTKIIVVLLDQTAIYGFINHLRDYGLFLLSLQTY